MKKYIFFATAIVLFCLTSTAWGTDSVAIARTVQKRYASIQNMKADFSQELTHKESGNVESRSGTLYFARPLLLRWETADPVPESLIITPDAIWNVFPDEDMAFKYAPGLADSESIVRVITGQSVLTEDFFVEQGKRENGLVLLSLIPKNPTQSMTEAALWVQAGTGIIDRVLITDFYNNTNDIKFTSQQFDAKDVTAVLFTFKPERNMKVEDKTSGGVISKPLMQ